MTARDGFAQLLRAEWTKLRSVRSTALFVLAAVILTPLLSMVAVSGSKTDAYQGPFYTDDFHFTHAPLTGDGTVTARVASQQDTGPWAKAGIILKESTANGAPYAAMMVTPGHGVRFQANFGTDVAGGRGGAPQWLRLTRAGSTVTGALSADGGTWRSVGTATLGTLGPTAEVGLFVTSPGVPKRLDPNSIGPVFTPSTATFDNVRVEPGPATAWRSADIGRPAVPGGGSEAGGVFTVTGTGDIWKSIPGDNDAIRDSLSGILLGVIAIVALGVLFVSTEYSKGMIRTTFTASPRRGRVLAAKAVVLGGFAFAVGLVATLAGHYLARPIQRDDGFRGPGYPDPALTDALFLRAVVGTAVVVAALALVGLAVGAVLRRTAAAITFAIALVIVPSFVASSLPESTAKWVERLTPLAGLAIQQTRERIDTVVEPWFGFGVALTYAVVALGFAAWLIRRRDA